MDGSRRQAVRTTPAEAEKCGSPVRLYAPDRCANRCAVQPTLYLFSLLLRANFGHAESREGTQLPREFVFDPRVPPTPHPRSLKRLHFHDAAALRAWKSWLEGSLLPLFLASCSPQFCKGSPASFPAGKGTPSRDRGFCSNSDWAPSAGMNDRHSSWQSTS